MRRTPRMVGFIPAGGGVKTSCETGSGGISAGDLVRTGSRHADVGPAFVVGGKTRAEGVAALA